MTTYGITPEGMVIYSDGQRIASVPLADIPLLIERLARALREGNAAANHVMGPLDDRSPW